MAGGLTLRPLRADETAAAARIHRRAIGTWPFLPEALHTPEDDRAFYRETVFPAGTILGAFDGKDLIGHIAFRPGWVDHFYVDPDRQSEGIGALLLERVKTELAEIRLWTLQANAGARRFYERHGFRVEEFTDGSANEEQLPDVRYRWRRRDEA